MLNEMINQKHIHNWKLDVLMDLLSEFDSLLCEAVNNKMQTARDYDNILVHLGGKAMTSLREVVCLCANGYPNGALSIARNIYEQFIILAFFEGKRKVPDFSEYVSDYFEDYDIQRNEALLFFAKNILKDEEERAQLRASIIEIKDNAFSRAKGKYWWSRKPNFAELAESVIQHQADETFQSFLYDLHLDYKRACLAIHASCMGNELDLGVSPDFVGVDMTFKENGHALPLYFSVSSFIGIAGYLGVNFGLECDSVVRELNELVVFYQKRLNADLKAGSVYAPERVETGA